MAATPIEIHSLPPNTEMPKVAPVPKEKPLPAPKETHPTGVARKQLEDIAAGKPVLETVAEQTVRREQAMQLLNEANALLLDMKDLRLLVSSIATQAADTPLGKEMQMETLRMLKEIPVDGVSPDLALRLTALQTKLTALPIPDANPLDNPLISTIQQFNITHPDSRVPEELLSQIQSGDVKSPELIAQILQSNQPLAQIVWKELTGKEEFKGFNPQPDIMLKLAGIEVNDENMKKAKAIFASALPIKEKPDLTGKLMSGALVGALTVMFVSQMAAPEGQQQGGH